MPLTAALLELRARADHVHVPARARVERQRQPVEAAARDVPVPHVAQPVVHALAVLRRRPLDLRVLVEHPLAHALDGDEPVVGRRGRSAACRSASSADRRGRPCRLRRAAPRSRRSSMIGSARLVGGSAGEPAVLGVEAARLVDRREHRQVVHLESSKSSRPAPGRDVDDPGARSSSSTSSHGITRCSTPAPGRGRRTGPRSASPTSSLPGVRSTKSASGCECDRHPVARRQPSVLDVGLDGGGDVRRQRPRRRRPDDERLAGPVEQRQAHDSDGSSRPGRRPPGVSSCCESDVPQRGHHSVERWPRNEPAALVHHLEEAPDVLDVGVAEREVVASPSPSTCRAASTRAQLVRGPRDDLAAARRRSARGRTPRSPSSSSVRATSRRRPRSTAPGSPSRSGSAGRSPAAPCSAGRRP